MRNVTHNILINMDVIRLNISRIVLDNIKVTINIDPWIDIIIQPTELKPSL